jgi:formiminoglutamase
MFQDPNWPRATQWLGSSDLNHAKLTVLGVPLNESISPGSCHLAPQEIRNALAFFSPYDVNHGVNLEELPCADLGDLPADNLTPDSAVGAVRLELTGQPKGVEATVLLGGDNGVTRPGVLSLGDDLPRIGVITLDAHFDLRETDGGLHNGNPIRALLDDGLPGKNIVQIGIQDFANSREYAEIAQSAGIEVVTAERVHLKGVDAIIEGALKWLGSRVDRIYVDLDIDVLDRGWCPGAPGARPGGLHPHQLKRAAYLLGREPRVRMMDIVEFDPDRDVNRVTAMAAASCLLSFAAGVASRA